MCEAARRSSVGTRARARKVPSRDAARFARFLVSETSTMFTMLTAFRVSSRAT